MTDDSVKFDGAISTITTVLLDRAKANDQAAWCRLVDVYSPLIFSWCKRKGLSSENARDVGQEVFLAVARKIGDFHRDQPSDTFRGWLWKITERKILDRWRRDANSVDAEGGTTANERIKDLPAQNSSESDSFDDDDARILAQRIIHLAQNICSAEDWQAFSRVVMQQQSPSDVAEDLGVTRNQVYLAKSRILHLIRNEFGDAMNGLFG